MKTNAANLSATVYFLSTAAGGRRDPLIQDRHRCVFAHQDHRLDCELLLEGLGDVWPGQMIVLPIRFLCPDSMVPRFQLGDQFQLREETTIADGIVVEIKS